MTDSFDVWSAALFFTTCRVTICFVVSYLLLRVMQIRSPRLHRIAWATVVCQGLILGSWTISVSLPVGRTDSTSATAQYVGSELNLEDAHLVPETLRETAPLPEIGTSLWDSSRRICVLVWVLGMVFFACREICRYANFLSTFSIGQEPSPESLLEWEKALQEFPRFRSIQLRTTKGAGPVVCFVPWGYLVLVPKTMWQTLSSESRVTVLRHELSHVQRMDLWKALAIRIAALPQWFNPLIWNAVSRFDEAGEWACDDQVRALSASEYDYANTLLTVGEYVSQPLSFMPSMSGGNLSKRIRRLVSEIKEDSIMKKCILTLGLVLVSLTAIRVQQVSAADDSNPQAETHRANEGTVPAMPRPSNELKLSVTRHSIELNVGSPRLVRFDVPVDAFRSRDVTIVKSGRKDTSVIELTALRPGSTEVEVQTPDNGTIVLDVAASQGTPEVMLQFLVCSFENDGTPDGQLAAVLAKHTSGKSISPMTLLDGPAYKQLFEQLGQLESIKVFAEPVLITVSGRPAAFSTIDASNTSAQTQSADTPGVRVEITPSVTETNSIRFAPRVFVARDGEKSIRKRFDQGVIEMKPDQTVVLTVMETSSDSKSRFFLVAVTPRLGPVAVGQEVIWGESLDLPKMGPLGRTKSSVISR